MKTLTITVGFCIYLFIRLFGVLSTPIGTQYGSYSVSFRPRTERKQNMNYIDEYISRKKQNEKLIKKLPLEEQSFWLEFLTKSDTSESSAERQNRRKTVSLDYSLTNGKNNHETAVLDLLVDNSPTALDKIIQKEEEDFITSLLPTLNVILDELEEVDKNIILLYFANEKAPSFRSMGRQLNMDYRKIQRCIPHIMKFIEDRLKQ